MGKNIITTFKSIVLLLLLLFAIISCHKGNDEPELISNKFIVGDFNQNLHYEIFDPPIIIAVDTGIYQHLYIDIDKDSYNDIHLTSLQNIIDSNYTELRTSVSSRVTYYIQSVYTYDTINLCVLEINDSCFIQTFYNQSSLFKCILPGVDSVYSYHWQSYSYPVIQSRGLVIRDPDSLNWKSGFHTLTEYKASEFVFHIDGNMITRRWNTFKNHWNNITEKYIVVKKVKPEGNYYGWIKLSVQNDNKILLHEHAIEKD